MSSRRARSRRAARDETLGHRRVEEEKSDGAVGKASSEVAAASFASPSVSRGAWPRTGSAPNGAPRRRSRPAIAASVSPERGGRRVATEDERGPVRGEVARERGGRLRPIAGLLLDESGREACREGREVGEARRPRVEERRVGELLVQENVREAEGRGGLGPGAIGMYGRRRAALRPRVASTWITSIPRRPGAAALGALAREEAGCPGVR